MRKLSWVRRKQGDQLIPVTWLWYSEKDGCKLPKSHVNLSWTVAGFQVIKVAWRRGNKSEPFFPTRCRQAGQMEKIRDLCTVDVLTNMKSSSVLFPYLRTPWATSKKEDNKLKECKSQPVIAELTYFGEWIMALLCWYTGATRPVPAGTNRPSRIQMRKHVKQQMKSLAAPQELLNSDKKDTSSRPKGTPCIV